MTYKNIVVAVDGSETSKLALNEAIQLSKENKAQLTILNIANEALQTLGWGGILMDFPNYRESIRKHSLELLSSLQNIAKENGISAITQLIEMKDPTEYIPEKIVQATQDLNADLLIIGTHGLRGFRKFFIGSVAQEVIRLATTPVLLVRGQK